MKLVESRTRALERENAELRAQVQALQDELQRAKETYELGWTQSVRHRLESVVRMSSIKLKPPMEHQRLYMRPTLAWVNRTTDSRLSMSDSYASKAFDSVLAYDDGRLIIPSNFDQANFLKPTQSSTGKTVTPSSYRRRGRDSAEALTNDSPPAPWFEGQACNNEQLSEDDSGHSTKDAEVCTECDQIDLADANHGDDTLRARSRFFDEKFYSTSASKCFVPLKAQARLLRAALRLAQETLWTALREHWPHIQRSIYLEGPEEVKFGREELYRGFGDETYPSQANEMCCQPRSLVIHHVLDVVYLRNAVCHPGHHSTKEVDNLIKYAQGLAVVLLDERRASKLRRLRDELQIEGTKSYEEIKAYVGLASLPFAKRWPVHQQRLFSIVRCERDFGGRNDWPEAVMRAAREWQLKYSRPGELDSRYMANVERAKTYMRATEHGRRASVSSIPRSEIDVSNSAESTTEDKESVERVELSTYSFALSAAWFKAAQHNQETFAVMDGW